MIFHSYVKLPEGNYGGLNPELRNFFGRQSWVGAWKINTVKYQSSLKRSCQIKCTCIHIQTYCKIASVKTIESKIVKDHHYGTKRLVWITTAVGLASYQWWNTSEISHECIFRELYTYIYIYTIYTHTHVGTCRYHTICNSICVYPPTPAFAKAGAAPGTTGGVEPALSRPWPSFAHPQRPKTFPGSFDQALEARAICD